MHLKIPLSSQSLRLSKSKPGCRVSTLHIVVKYIPPMTIWHRAHKCFFQLLIPGLTPVSLLQSELGFEIVTQLAGTGKWPSSNLWSKRQTTARETPSHLRSKTMRDWFRGESVIKRKSFFNSQKMARRENRLVSGNSHVCADESANLETALVQSLGVPLLRIELRLEPGVLLQHDLQIPVLVGHGRHERLHRLDEAARLAARGAEQVNVVGVSLHELVELGQRLLVLRLDRPHQLDELRLVVPFASLFHTRCKVKDYK